MRGVVSKVSGVLSINNLLSVSAILYFGSAIKNLYGMSQVPVATDEVPVDARVRSHIAPDQVVDMDFYLTNEPSGPISKSLFLGNITEAVYSFDFVDETSSSSSGHGGKLVLTDLQLPKKFCTNQTLYLQTVASSNGKLINHRVYALSLQLIPIDDRDSKHFLLDGNFDETIDLVYPYSSIPSVIEAGLILETREMDGIKLMQRGLGHYIDGKSKSIRLPLHLNPYITPRDEYVSLATCPKVDLTIVYKPVGMSYWMLSETLIRSFDQLEQQMSVNEYDIDSFKMLVTGSSLTKLAVVYLVSLLHFIFEYLSIKSDLSFWKSKTTFDGISESSISMNVAMGLISALYVIEQGESKIALYFILIKMGMNVWKIFKLRNSASAEKQSSAMETLHQDETKCMRYLMIGLIPLVVAFCAYRLVFYKYRSWYSWAILSLTAASEVFGFVTMTPQIFMNYRLKSVEHLPWTALTYSFINTFIDDLFAFGIFRVPEVSRYSCLRDDIVFVIVCIQRWWYRGRRSDEDPDDIKESKKDR